MTTTTRSPEETRGISRLRALGQGVKVYCLDKDKLCSCPAGIHDKWCKHVAAVEMFREAQEQLEQATALAVTVSLHYAPQRSLEDKLSDLY